MSISPEILAELLWTSAEKIYRESLPAERISRCDRHFPQFLSKKLDQNGTFTIEVGTDIQVELFTNQYASDFVEALNKAGGNDDVKKVVFVEKPDSKPVAKAIEETPQVNEVPVQKERSRIFDVIEKTSSKPPLPRSTTATQLERRAKNKPVFHENYTFENFVEGPANSIAYAAAQAVSKNPGRNAAYNPLFIWGGTGLGKTHLMEAIGHVVWNTRPAATVINISTERFMNEYVSALQNKTMEQFRDKYRKADLFLLDDVQFAMSKSGFQDELFNTFSQLQISKKQMVMTCDVKPSSLPNFESRLKSRFEGGMVVEIELPSFETRLAIIRNKARSLKRLIPNEILDFIAENIRSHVRAMEGALTKVDMFASMNPDKPLTLEVVKRLLRDSIEDEATLKKLSMEDILKAVSDHYRIPVRDIIDGGRMQALVTARQMAMFLARKLTQFSLPEIGQAFGKNHATVHHGAQNIKKRLDVEPRLKEDVRVLCVTMGRKAEEVLD